MNSSVNSGSSQEKATRCIGLDFDDTLFPTSMVDSICSTDSPAFETRVAPAIADIDAAAADLVDACVQVPHCTVCLITNGGMGWIELALRASPLLKAAIQRGMDAGNMCVVSARDRFEDVYPRQKLKWKVHSWEAVAEPHVSYILTVGDSHLDGQAPANVCKARGTCRVRFVRIENFNTVPGFVKELKNIQANLHNLMPLGHEPPEHKSMKQYYASNLFGASHE